MQMREIMPPRVEVIHPDATLQEAAEKMQRLDIGPLPVCDGDRLVGIVSLGDLAVRIDEDELADEEVGETLAGVSEPSRPGR